MKRSILLSLLLATGCTAVFDSHLPATCVTEDADGDGFIAPECVEGSSTAGTDCDETNAMIHPGADETCNLVDDDCDRNVDEGIPIADYFPDCDLDGFGADMAPPTTYCGEPPESLCPTGGGQWVTQQGDCDDQNANRQVACGACAEVDFLIVMDTSNSMTEEQLAFSMQLPWMVHVLKTGDHDGDGVADAEPIQDIHVGVITPDMGSGNWDVPTCERGFGEDGILRSRSGAPLDCAGFSLDPPFLEFSPEEGDTAVAEFTDDWSCLVRAGIGGCGFEQPLEAALKALTPASSTIRFRGDTLGHGDGLNRGFLHEDSLLVVLVVTDEDDCSAADAELFYPGSTTYEGDLNLRCYQYPEAVQPITRYVSGLLQLRPADDLIFGIVAGVPDELVPPHGVEPDYGAILGDTRLAERVDATMPNRLAFSCAIPGRGSAFPPRRLLELAEGLQLRGSTTVLSSICSDDAYRPIAEAILQAAAAHGARRCGPRLGE